MSSSLAGAGASSCPTEAADPAEEERTPVGAGWLPGPRLGAALAIGSLWFALGLLWSGLVWLGALWWAALLAGVCADLGALRESGPSASSGSPPSSGQGTPRAQSRLARGSAQGGGRVTARRLLEPVLSVGVANPVAVVLRNRSRRLYRALLRDEPPLDFAVDRRRLTCQLPPGGEASEAYRVTPPRRGDYSFGAVNLRLTTGFGLVVRQLKFDLAGRVQVYPNLAGIRAHEIAARKHRLSDIGVHLSRVKGTGLEFESLRAYVPGDELRRIDWKATARRDEPITREYDLERSQHIILCLDLGRTMASELGDLRKADHAINAAALLAHVAARVGDWVGLYAFAQGPIAYVPPRKHQFSLVLDSLYGLQPELAESDYYRAFLYAAQRIHKRSLVVLFTDLLDPESSSRLLTYVTLLTRRHLVVCAALSDYELYELVARSPGRARDLYERTVATSLLADRQKALSALRGRGAIALDATPADLSVAVLNRYLAIKERARL